LIQIQGQKNKGLIGAFQHVDNLQIQEKPKEKKSNEKTYVLKIKIKKGTCSSFLER
jgi:hypothetical protein